MKPHNSRGWGSSGLAYEGDDGALEDEAGSRGGLLCDLSWDGCIWGGGRGIGRVT